jgi:hypothetical protein
MAVYSTEGNVNGFSQAWRHMWEKNAQFIHDISSRTLESNWFELITYMYTITLLSLTDAVTLLKSTFITDFEKKLEVTLRSHKHKEI